MGRMNWYKQEVVQLPHQHQLPSRVSEDTARQNDRNFYEN